METKYVKIPFDIELAKKITNGESEGRIVTRNGENVRIVSFDRKNQYRPIIVLVDDGENENVYALGSDGKEISGDTIGTNDLMLEIPEYMSFRDGDILTDWPNGNGWCIFICKSRNKDILSSYVTYYCDSIGNNILRFDKSLHTSILCNPSTESEKQSLIDALKESKEPKAKEYLKRFFGIEEKQEYAFNFRDMVLVRASEKDKWCAAEFSHKDGKWYAVFGGLYYEQCIPYNEETAHLLGTKNDYIK